MPSFPSFFKKSPSSVASSVSAAERRPIHRRDIFELLHRGRRKIVRSCVELNRVEYRVDETDVTRSISHTVGRAAFSLSLLENLGHMAEQVEGQLKILVHLMCEEGLLMSPSFPTALREWAEENRLSVTEIGPLHEELADAEQITHDTLKALIGQLIVIYSTLDEN